MLNLVKCFKGSVLSSGIVWYSFLYTAYRAVSGRVFAVVFAWVVMRVYFGVIAGVIGLVLYRVCAGVWL